jgi:hypothetical protein
MRCADLDGFAPGQAVVITALPAATETDRRGAPRRIPYTEIAPNGELAGTNFQRQAESQLALAQRLGIDQTRHDLSPGRPRECGSDRTQVTPGRPSRSTRRDAGEGRSLAV